MLERGLPPPPDDPESVKVMSREEAKADLL